jgi:hypothetical protein
LFQADDVPAVGDVGDFFRGPAHPVGPPRRVEPG